MSQSLNFFLFLLRASVRACVRACVRASVCVWFSKVCFYSSGFLILSARRFDFSTIFQSLFLLKCPSAFFVFVFRCFSLGFFLIFFI